MKQILMGLGFVLLVGGIEAFGLDIQSAVPDPARVFRTFQGSICPLNTEYLGCVPRRNQVQWVDYFFRDGASYLFIEITDNRDAKEGRLAEYPLSFWAKQIPLKDPRFPYCQFAHQLKYAVGKGNDVKYVTVGLLAVNELRLCTQEFAKVCDIYIGNDGSVYKIRVNDEKSAVVEANQPPDPTLPEMRENLPSKKDRAEPATPAAPKEVKQLREAKSGPSERKEPLPSALPLPPLPTPVPMPEDR